MRNGEYEILLKLAPIRTELSVLGLVNLLWPTSEQVLKKCKTIDQRVLKMERAGLVRSRSLRGAARHTGVLWSITAKGRSDGMAEQCMRDQRRGGSSDGPLSMRINTRDDRGRKQKIDRKTAEALASAMAILHEKFSQASGPKARRTSP